MGLGVGSEWVGRGFSVCFTMCTGKCTIGSAKTNVRIESYSVSKGSACRGGDRRYIYVHDTHLSFFLSLSLSPSLS